MQNELYHHGVKGMKWGVRKAKESSGSKRSKTEDWSEDAKESHRLSRKKASQLSNSELKKVNERRNLEQQFRKLNPDTIAKGIKYIGSAAAITGTTIAVISNSKKLIETGKEMANAIAIAKKSMQSVHL